MANILEVKENNFEQQVLNSNKVVLIDFWAQWCGPCRKLTPILEQIQNEFLNEIKVVKIDTEENINIAKEYGVSSLPTILIMKDKEVKEMIVGMMPKSAIISNIKKYI